MGTTYQQKLYISGNEVESYEYLDTTICRGYKRKVRKPKPDKPLKTLFDKPPAKTKFSIHRTKTQVRRLVNANPQLTKFITLTTTTVDLKLSNKQFNLFTQRMITRYPEFQYVAVVEFQRDIDFHGNVKPMGGAVHYHLLSNLRYVRGDLITEIWGQGFIKIRRVDNSKGLGRYMTKYLNKDVNNTRLFGKKKFFCSQDLNRSIELTDFGAFQYLRNNEANLKLLFEKTFSNEYTGEVKYQLFNSSNFTPATHKEVKM